jgi:tRNA (cytidine/uridine-2'-O-)-methyltransferase
MIHVVLYEPEIPQNTGNIMRTCVAIGAKLHLIEPLGFKLDEQRIRRSGMDYIDDLDYEVHASFEAYLTQYPMPTWMITRYGMKTPYDVKLNLQEDVFVMFGKESTGIPKSILSQHLDRCLRLPMVASARSLNLSNAVAIVVYEVLRQRGFPGLASREVLKGEDWLLK